MPAIKLSSFIVLSLLATATASAAAERQAPLSGRWTIDDGKAVLEIRGTEWRHPEFGTATIKRGDGAADIEVFYQKAEGMKCAYRYNFSEDGDTLFLEKASGPQSMDYCPTGKLTRVVR